ncbi:LytTR family DNA-binding domain-containing protein [Anaerosporobacter sp.]|uniref:LytTR family DNA-binding domain-containing protein n=1 Tax=Anaerosporobacter sp. TaxID=1872529 RepID=UPI00286EE63F|nr:LytTR family DNA-binding domain-containing protein [Anaerosporobacter sp.]
MNIQIIEDIKEALQIIIKCKQKDDEVIRLKTYIELFDKKLQAKKDNAFYFVNVSEVLYFESIDNRTFLYTKDDVMEIKQRLYELEIILSDKDFIRISKSQIANINKIRSLKPELNRTIIATMSNNEQLYISRKYVQAIRSILSI